MTPLDRLKKLFGALFILPIRFYQKYISSGLPARCRYYPSCSHYAIEAIKKHGVIKGIILGSWRIVRCNPWSRGGVDHVPEKFDFFYYKRDLLNRKTDGSNNAADK